MNRVSEVAAHAKIIDMDGQEHDLMETWARRPAVLAFVRHFGCLLCREQVVQLRREVDTIHAHGAELVVIGNGNRHFASAFREDLQLDTPLYVDTARASYRALGMKRGIARTLGSWRTWIGNLRGLQDGFRQKRVRIILSWWSRSVPALIPGTQGDAWQLGGVFVVLPDGRVPYRYLSSVAGDHPPPTEVLAALEAATR